MYTSLSGGNGGLVRRPVLREQEVGPGALVHPGELLLGEQEDAAQHQLRHALRVLNLKDKYVFLHIIYIANTTNDKQIS